MIVRIFIVVRVALIVLGCVGSALAGTLSNAYISPQYFLKWDTDSHWIQAWRSYMETVPASVFVDGTGIGFNVTVEQADNIATMLERSGIHHARVEMPWGAFDYANENQYTDLSMAKKLAILRKHHIRPLILLNSNSGRPCPEISFRRTVARNALAGDRTIELDDVNDIVVGYSGLSNVGKDKGAANILIVALSGNTATLSKPLPISLPSGAKVDLATLKYRPFSAPGTVDFTNTLRGWQTYVLNVALFARRALGTTNQPDGGFDLEIWNELTFGSLFLSIDNYYAPAPGTSPGRLMWGPIVDATASVATVNPALFSGALIGDGFANTIPWRAAADEPARVDAIDKHPYRRLESYPDAEPKATHLNAALAVDEFVPTYSSDFPEFWATSIRSDNILREMAPFSSSVGGKLHGRYARIVNGQVLPVTVWITEANNDPRLDNPSISNAAAIALKAKTTARYFAFYLNKGVTQVDLYAVQDRNAEWQDRAMSLVLDDFLKYCSLPGAQYPADDAQYVSPSLMVTSRMVKKMEDGLDRTLSKTRQLHVGRVTAKIDPVIFSGDGTMDHPDFHAVDAFTFLPYQVNAHRFVIPYYVMTRDVTKPWPEDVFTVDLAGVAADSSMSVYDPMTDQMSTVVKTPVPGGVRLALPIIDYPRLLIIDEGAH